MFTRLPRGAPGAHVVVRAAGRTISEEALRLAAQLAAYYSKLRGERAAQVVVAHLPGPLRIDRHSLRGPAPKLAEHGPLLSVLSRLGRTALGSLVARLNDPGPGSAELRKLSAQLGLETLVLEREARSGTRRVQ